MESITNLRENDDAPWLKLKWLVSELSFVEILKSLEKNNGSAIPTSLKYNLIAMERKQIEEKQRWFRYPFT